MSSSNICETTCYIYIYIYIYEIGSSYIWCNSTRVTYFLNHRFSKNLTVRRKKKQ